ncbi:MAG: adenylosuccinate synthase [Spirochaetales bacterium]|nr:adenylosuccinate synthase [Candidatus Physcosoma equi]
MAVNCVVGLQWGDEGKGRIVDYLAQQADIVIRYQGGDNAGHTVVNEKGKFGLHILPSGIFNDDTMNIVGAGTVVNFDRLHSELAEIEEKTGEKIQSVFVDERAHVIMPYHMALDGAEEAKRDESKKIGTTKRGIGPCYTDKATRCGIRACDILDEDTLRTKLEAVLPKKNRDLEYYGLPTFTVEELLKKCAEWKAEFGDHIIDTIPAVREAVETDKSILLEGQLGIMRDNDWGIYPYSTSSNPTAAGGCNGAGIPPRAISHVYGVAKAYSTSVGGGPYMTELFDETADKLRAIGHEYGVTTGRPRRCGWFDAVACDYACYMNGVTDVCLTKVDVLDSFETLKVCTGYMINGEYYSYLPETRLQEQAKPIYEEFEGWMADTTGCRKWEDLPAKCQAFILKLEELIKAPITLISVGPERDQLIIRESALSK